MFLESLPSHKVLPIAFCEQIFQKLQSSDGVHPINFSENYFLSVTIGFCRIPDLKIPLIKLVQDPLETFERPSASRKKITLRQFWSFFERPLRVFGDSPLSQGLAITEPLSYDPGKNPIPVNSPCLLDPSFNFIFIFAIFSAMSVPGIHF